MTNKTEHVEMEVPDPTADRLAALRDLIPEAFSEGKVDFDKLRAALGDVVDERPERYSFTWAGKRDAIRLLQTPSSATLVPAPEESVNWDTTQHLFIEGDNLEVLKLLYKAYFGKVKLIYIDPPYNTGNDFVYPDDFTDPLGRYLEVTGQKDAAGNLLTSNPETSGRYHSAWLSMMYPRLFLARQLLRNDGVLLVSLDDTEASTLVQLLNEIFGEEHFAGIFAWRSRTAKADVPFGVSKDVEWVICYANSGFFAGRPGERKYYKSDEYEDRWRLSDLTTDKTAEQRPNSFFTMVNPKTGEQFPANATRTWAVTKQTFPDYHSRGKIVFPGDYPFLNLTRPAYRVFEQEDKDKALQKHGTEDIRMPISTYLPEKEVGRTEHGSKDIRYLFGKQVFSYPKPVSLIQYFVETCSDKGDLVLDFFAGSGTTAHAVLAQNMRDHGGRRFVLVQLPEPLDALVANQKTAYDFCIENGFDPTLAEVSKERVRRAIVKVSQDESKKLPLNRNKPDLGFRVFKLAPSTIRAWRGTAAPTPAEYVEQLALLGQPLRDGWRAEDVVWEVAIKEGFPLTSRVATAAAAGQQVYRVEDPDSGRAFHICLDDKVEADVAAALGLAAGDLLVVRDAAVDDTTAANLALTCRLKTL